MEILELEKTVSEAARQAGFARHVKTVAVQRALDEHEDEFLRVEIELRPTKENIDSELEAAIERIEDAVAQHDDRYPSVRFLDAA